MAVAIPSGIQVFAWIATLASGRAQLDHADAVRARLPLHLRAGRPDRRDARGRAVRLAGARHLLRRRAPALRADRRHGVPAVRRVLLLDAVREPPARSPSASAAGCSACMFVGLQRRVLPDAHHRARRHAAARATPMRAGSAGTRSTSSSTVGAFMIAAGVAAVPLRLRAQLPLRVRGQRRQRLGRGHARVAAERPLLEPQHPASSTSR